MWAEGGRSASRQGGDLASSIFVEAAEAPPPVDEAVGEGSGSPAAANGADDAADPPATQASAGPAPETASGRGKKRPRARRGRPEFVLPPRNAAKASARSCHFRLPAEIEAKLAELAEEHGCSKTHVVCAAIESAWTRLDRERRRGPS